MLRAMASCHIVRRPGDGKLLIVLSYIQLWPFVYKFSVSVCSCNVSHAQQTARPADHVKSFGSLDSMTFRNHSTDFYVQIRYMYAVKCVCCFALRLNFFMMHHTRRT